MTTSNRLNLVVDTNVLLAAFSRKSQFHWFYQKLRDKKFDISLTNEILAEYEEKFSQLYDSFVAVNVAESLLTASNVTLVTPYYRWNLIDADQDDNKFVDCAVAANADFIITNDKHFNALKSIDFPKIKILTIEEFADLLQK